jgi:flagellar biosynthesis protein FlhF
MKIKKYIVKTLSEVDDMVRRDLGPNAVILTVRKIKYKGISSLFFSDQLEVVAAVDESGSPSPGIPAPAQKTKEKELTREWESPMQTLADLNNSFEAKPLPGLEEPAQYEISKIPGTYLDPRFNRKQIVETANETILPEEPSEINNPDFEIPATIRDEAVSMQNFAIEISNLKQVSQSLIQQFAFSIASASEQKIEKLATDDEKLKNRLEKDSQLFLSLMSWLLSLGLDSKFAEEITKSLQARYGSDFIMKDKKDGEFIECVAKEIAGRIPVAGPLLLAKGIPTCMAIIGPTGIGKTSVLLKIAAQYSEEARKKVGILATKFDAKLQSYCEEFGLPLKLVQNKKELNEGLSAFQEYDLILLDITGFSRVDKSFAEEWANNLKGIQLHLALNAGIKEIDAKEWGAFFQKFSPKALIITKVDETSSLGSIPTLSDLLRLPISYLSTGPAIPLDLEIADPNAIAQAIVSQQVAYVF